jgi:hypothetical protein
MINLLLLKHLIDVLRLSYDDTFQFNNYLCYKDVVFTLRNEYKDKDLTDYISKVKDKNIPRSIDNHRIVLTKFILKLQKGTYINDKDIFNVLVSLFEIGRFKNIGIDIHWN